MKTTLTLAANLNCSPFEIFAEDCDDVIMLINYFLLTAKHDEHRREMPKPTTAKPKKDERIRVNDRTATGGWF